MFTVESDLLQLKGDMNELALRHFPKIVAIALTKTAKQTQFALQGHAKQVFKNTTPWYNQGSPVGFRVTPAMPNKLTSTVYSHANFLPRQIRGDLRTAYSGDLAIPSYGAKAVGHKARWAGAARKNKGLFRIGQELYKRDTGAKRPTLWYVLRPAARGTRLFHMVEVSRKVMQRSYRKHEQEASYAVISRLPRFKASK